MTSDDGYEQLGYGKPSLGHTGWAVPTQHPKREPHGTRCTLVGGGGQRGQTREGHLHSTWGPTVWLGREDRAPRTQKVGAP